MNTEQLSLLDVPEKNFIENYNHAKHIVDQACYSHCLLWKLIKAWQDHIEGAKPVDPKKLKQMGMDWVDNWNYGKARSKIEKGVAENSNRLMQSIFMAEPEFRGPKPEDAKDLLLSFLHDMDKRCHFAEMINRCFVDALEHDDSFSAFIQNLEYPSYTYGYSAVVYDPINWMGIPVSPLHIAFDPQTKPSDISIFVVFDSIKPRHLYQYWLTAKKEQTKLHDNEDGTKERYAVGSHWNVEALEKVLKESFQGKINGVDTPESWEVICQGCEYNSTTLIQGLRDLPVAKIFYKEIDGTVTELYIPYDQNFYESPGEKVYTQTTYASSVAEILYRRNHSDKEMSSYINLAKESGFTENGFINEMRGMAKYAVEDSIRYNRNRNLANNKMKFVGAPMYENVGGSQIGEKFKINVSQGFILNPAGYRLVDKQPQFDIGSHITMIQFEENEYLRDTSQYDQSLQGRISSRPTEQEIESISQEIQTLARSRGAVKVKDYGFIFFNMLKRLVSTKPKTTDVGYEGKQFFYQRMKEEFSDVIKSDADVKRLIDTVISFQIEPTVSDSNALAFAMQQAETAYGRRKIKRSMLFAQGFPRSYVNVIVPQTEDQYGMYDDERVAAFENDGFWNGSEAVFRMGDDHISHLKVHFAKTNQVFQGVQQQQLQPVQAVQYLRGLLQHEGLHVDALGENPIFEEDHKQAKETYDNFVKMFKDLDQMAQQQMQQQAAAQAQQPQMTPKDQADVMRKDQVAAATVQRKDQIAQVNTQMKVQKQQADIALDAREVELQHEVDMAEAEMKAQAKAAEKFQTP